MRMICKSLRWLGMSFSLSSEQINCPWASPSSLGALTAAPAGPAAPRAPLEVAVGPGLGDLAALRVAKASALASTMTAILATPLHLLLLALDTLASAAAGAPAAGAPAAGAPAAGGAPAATNNCLPLHL